MIRRFVDHDAEFLFVAQDEVKSVAEREGALPYDVPDVKLGHVDGRCSFESIIVKYQITEPALDLLAKIVHGAAVLRGSWDQVSAPMPVPDRYEDALGLIALGQGQLYELDPVDIRNAL